MKTDSEIEIERIRVLIRERINEVRRGQFATSLVGPLSLVQTDNPVLLAELEVPALMILSHVEGHGLAAKRLQDVNTRLGLCDPDTVDPEITWARLNYTSMMLIGLGKQDQAQARLDEGLHVTKRHERIDWESSLLLTRARSYLEDGQMIAAARDLARVVGLDSSAILVGLANSQLADLFESFGQHDQAMEYRSRSLNWQLDPHGNVSTVFQQFTVLAPLMLSEIEASDFEGAQTTRDVCDQLLNGTDSKLVRSILTHLEAVLLIRTGRLVEGLAVLDGEDADLAASGHLVSNLCIPLVRAGAFVDLGRHDEGLGVIDQALANGATDAHQQRLCELAIRSCREAENWEVLVGYQERLVEVMRRRRIDSRDLHSLYTEHARSLAQRGASKRLAAASRSLDVSRSDHDALLDVVTHDVMSPLSSLKLLLDSMVLAEESGNLSSERDQRFTVTLGHIQKIVNQLAVLGGTFEGSADNKDLATDLVELADLIPELIDAHRELAEQKNIELVFEADADLPATLGPPESISHIVQNLLSNAIKFSEPGCVVRVRVLRRINRRPGNDGASILVIDEGPGLTGNDLDRLFTRYGQLSAQPTAGETSTGLGLYIADRFSTSLGANLSASSGGVGRGSTFRLDLPSWPASDTARSQVGRHLVANA